MPDGSRRDDAAQRSRARRTTWVFIGITVVMAVLTLAFPYLAHRTRTVHVHAAARPSPDGATGK